MPTETLYKIRRATLGLKSTLNDQKSTDFKVFNVRYSFNSLYNLNLILMTNFIKQVLESSYEKTFATFDMFC